MFTLEPNLFLKTLLFIGTQPLSPSYIGKIGNVRQCKSKRKIAAKSFLHCNPISSYIALTLEPIVNWQCKKCKSKSEGAVQSISPSYIVKIGNVRSVGVRERMQANLFSALLTLGSPISPYIALTLEPIVKIGNVRSASKSASPSYIGQPSPKLAATCIPGLRFFSKIKISITTVVKS